MEDAIHLDEELVLNVLEQKSKSFSIVKKDNGLEESDNDSLKKHNDLYTTLLENYVSNYKKNAEKKLEKREEIYQLSVALMVFTPIATMCMIAVAIGAAIFGIDTVSLIPEMVAAFGTMMSFSVITFKIITKYLFDKNEEKNMADIVSKIQDYDKAIRMDSNERYKENT